MSYIQEAMGEEEEPENHFHRLPDDLVLHIFEKLSSLKCLWRCFVVSKRFASLILCVRTVSYESEVWNHISNFLNQNKNPERKSFLGGLSEFLIDNLVVKPLRYLLNLVLLPSLPPNVPVFNLKRIQSLNIEIPFTFTGNNDFVFKWGIKYSTKLDSVTFLCATSLSKVKGSKEEDDDGDKEETENEVTSIELMRRVPLAFECARHAVLRIATLSLCIPRLPMIQSVTINDSNEKAVKLCLRGEKLVECKNTFNVSMLNSLLKRTDSWTPENLKVGNFPVLQLPISGYVMKGVTIVNFKLFADDDYEEDTAMLDAFAEEQGVFLEALVQILENHKGSIKALV